MKEQPIMQNEKNLIKRLKEKDSQALSILYDNYSGAIYGVLLKMSRDETIAQEVLQDTFLKIWDKSAQYDPDKGKFYTWAYRIARHQMLNFLRKPSLLIQNEDVSVYKDKEAPEDRTEALLELRGCIQKLEPHHQKALELVYFNGLTHREAHEEMDVPLGTFKSYIQQAVKKMRELYNKELLVLILFLENVL